MQFYDISSVDGALTIHIIKKGYSYVCTKSQAQGVKNSIYYTFQLAGKNRFKYKLFIYNNVYTFNTAT